MKSFIPHEIDRYAHDHTRARPALFDELHDYTFANMSMPQMQVGRVEGSLLKLLCALCGASRVIEIGTFTGYSALCMAEALPEGGQLITCDIDPAAAKVARSFFDRSPHGEKITIALGDALDTLQKIPQKITGPFDLAFIDADKARYVAYYEALLPLLRPGGLIVADNVLWSGEVLDPHSEDAKGLCAFNDKVAADPRVENAFLTVRDGINLVRKV